MKKYLSIILCIVVILSAFVACSGKDKGKDNETGGTTTTTTTTTTTALATDAAKIKEADAINLIQSYDAKELGLDKDVIKECSFMVASSGEHIYEQKADYIKVIATIKQAHKDAETKEITYTFDTKGEYYIRFDGKQILSKNVETGEYTEMAVKKVPTTTTTQSEHE